MGQIELDLRLNYDRSLKENLINVAKFTENQMKQENQMPKAVESKQEGYGIAAQAYVKVTACQKTLKGSMDDYLKLLDADGEANQVTGEIYNAALELAQASVIMAAQASRILADLYFEQAKSPLEEYLDTTELEGDGEED